MPSVEELWNAYGRDRRPDNIGAIVDGIRLGELDDDIQDVVSSYAGLGAGISVYQVAKLSVALARTIRVLPSITPVETRAYFERLATLAEAVLAELARAA